MKSILDLPCVSHMTAQSLADIVQRDSESLETFAARLELSERLQEDWRDYAPFRPNMRVDGLEWDEVAAIHNSYT